MSALAKKSLKHLLVQLYKNTPLLPLVGINIDLPIPDILDSRITKVASSRRTNHLLNTLSSATIIFDTHLSSSWGGVGMHITYRIISTRA